LAANNGMPHWTRFLYLAILLVPAPAALKAQVFQVNGGTSSLYQADGGTISARGPSFDASAGAGILDGKFVGGMNLTKMIGRSTYIAGSDYVHFVLPTDIFDSSQYLVAMGAGVKTKIADTNVFAFGGATSLDFSSPLFEGARAETPAGILFVNRKLGSTLSTYSSFVFSKQTTAIQSFQWQPLDKLQFAVSGGVGANQPYGAASFQVARPWIDAKAAYIEAGSQFHRVAVEEPLMSEPDRENILVTVRPTHFFSISGGRQNFLTPVGNTQQNVRSGLDQVSGSAQAAGVGFSGTFYHSTFLGQFNNATDYTLDRSIFSRIHASTSYLESRPSDGQKTRTFLSTFTETLTPRLDVSQMISRSQGQTTLSFGGAILSNLLTLSANYQTYYLPQLNSAPFQQALIVDVQLHLFRGVTLHGATFVAPDGSLRYTSDAQTTMVRQGSGGMPDGFETLARDDIGRDILHGSVVDKEGQPVAGAALMIDHLLVYTDDHGLFFVREHKPHVHALKVMTNDFLSGEGYSVVSAPATVSSSTESNAPGITIVVERTYRGE